MSCTTAGGNPRTRGPRRRHRALPAVHKAGQESPSSSVCRPDTDGRRLALVGATLPKWIDPSLLRSIRPEARNVAGFGPDDRGVRRGGNRARRSSEVCPWDRTDQGPPLGLGDFLGLTTADGLNPYSRGCKPCAIAYGGLGMYEDVGGQIRHPQLR